MLPFLDELLRDFPTLDDFVRVTFKLFFSAMVGGLIGMEREATNKEAGLRTHMLVALGSTIFVLALVEVDASNDAISRAVQGVAAGIGFVGAGNVLKLSSERRVRGLTTAASIWLTAALGVAVGLGKWWLPILGAILTWVILWMLVPVERMIRQLRRRKRPKPSTTSPQ
ncbi:MAG: MgtC/SapB family protein [Pirellulales bacterium]